ncbi:MAG: hypothetical protein QM778_34585 [Myxococcales bacterium]
MLRRFAPWLLSCTLSAWSASALAQADQGLPAPEPRIAPHETHEAQAKQDWWVTVTPYLWLATASNDLGERTVNANVGQLIKLMNAAFMINAQAQYRNFGLVTDYMFVSLDTTKELGSGSLDLDAKENVLDVRAAYRVLDTRPGHRKGEPGAQLMIDMGARYWNIGSTVHAVLPPVRPNGTGIDRKVDATESWADFIVGARYLSDITHRVGLGLAANFGGFNIANCSRFTWEVTTGVRFTVWRHLQFDVGYRALQALRDSQDLKGNVRTTKLTMQGPILGIGATF